MRRTATLAAAAFALALAPAAQADPTANGEGLQDLPATCDGVEGTITHSQGSSFYFGGTHYVLRSISGSTTGGEPLFSKEFGGGGGPTITCTAQETGDEGPVDLTIVAFPAP
jgi:hypothetical protein